MLCDLSDQRDDAPLPHYVEDDGPHLLDGVEMVLAGSAGDGFIRSMKKRGADVLLNGKTVPADALALLVGRGLAGPALRYHHQPVQAARPVLASLTRTIAKHGFSSIATIRP